MKTSLNILCAAAAALLCGCAKEEKSESAELEQITLSATFAASPSAEIKPEHKSDQTSNQKPEHQTESRATATAFESGDELGLFVVKSGMEVQKDGNLVNNHKMIVGSDGVIKGTPTAVYYPTSSSQATSPTSLYSYYPYQSGDATADALGVLVGIRTDQTDFLDVKRSDLCFGSLDNVEPSTSAKVITFRHSFAQVRVNVALFAGCPAIKQLRLINVKDSATLNMQTGVVTLKSHTAEVLAYKSAENSYSTIIPAQTLNGACIAIDLVDNKTTYIFNAISPISLTQSATNTVNLAINDKGIASLSSTPAVTAWTTATSSGMMNSAINNQISLYWLAPHSDYATADKITLSTTDPLGVTRDIDLTPTLDPTSSPDYAIYKLNLSLSGATYPLVVNKIRVYKGATMLRDCITDAMIGKTISKPGLHTIGMVIWMSITPSENWYNVSGYGASKPVKIVTNGTDDWTATATGTGLSVHPTSGKSGQTATIYWNTNGGLVAPASRMGKVTFETKPQGVTMEINTSQLGVVDRVNINGLIWAAGDLVAHGSNGCRIGAPIDYGLYFQYGSLIGWSGGATGDGVGAGVPPLFIAAKPEKCTVTAWNSTWSGDASTINPVTGVGDPCTYYLKGAWRLPKPQEYISLYNCDNGTAWANCPNGAWQATPAGSWAGTDAKTTRANSIFIGAAGYRHLNMGTPYLQGANGARWTSQTASSSNTFDMAFDANAITPYSNWNRPHALTTRCVADDVVDIGGVMWAKGNLVANGQNSCVNGKPEDGGLYFQFGSLIGWKGGATGDGKGRAARADYTFYGGATFNASDEVAAYPSVAAAAITAIGTTWPNQTVNKYYFGLNTVTTDGFNINTYPGVATGAMAADGVGDPCTYYVGSPWRLPTNEEYQAMYSTATNISWQGSSWVAGVSTDSYLVLTYANGDQLKFPAAGLREPKCRYIGSNACYISSSVYNATNAYRLDFWKGAPLQPTNAIRNVGYLVRCVK